MQFETTLKTFIDFFEGADIRYAVTGELALLAYGMRYVHPQIEFAVDAGQRKQVLEYLTSLGYAATFSSPRCSVHTLENVPFGKVAFLYTTLRLNLIPVSLCGVPWVPVGRPATRFALTEADVQALNTATMQLEPHAWADWNAAVSANLPPSRETNSDSDEPFSL
jgi:hypothetical protein